jgi:hypothetical protein
MTFETTNMVETLFVSITSSQRFDAQIKGYNTIFAMPGTWFLMMLFFAFPLLRYCLIIVINK